MVIDFECLWEKRELFKIAIPYAISEFGVIPLDSPNLLQ